jgi:hypothetical protein
MVLIRLEVLGKLKQFNYLIENLTCDLPVFTGNIKKIMFLGSEVRPIRVADNLTAVY